KLAGPICKHQGQVRRTRSSSMRINVAELNQMVNFKDYTSPSSKLKYLIIKSNERPAMQTKLL
ncbi:hypothetical protein HAX54_032541, partial [Datura stramonium]|nr:hypothetical protein [Datura stramonium]